MMNKNKMTYKYKYKSKMRITNKHIKDKDWLIKVK
jgi:hypothetical protein